MYEKIMKVFYGEDCLPYKDQERTVHFPITGGSFVGASNTTQIRFYIDKIGNYTDTWVANSKLPNGKMGNKILSSANDTELNEHYVYLNLSSFYTQAKGDLYISLNGFYGGVTITESDGQYSISGIPTIQATGVIKIAINYATPLQDGEEVQQITLAQVLAEIGTKVSKNDNKYLKVVSSSSALNTQTYKDYVFSGDLVIFADTGLFVKISGEYPSLTWTYQDLYVSGDLIVNDFSDIKDSQNNTLSDKFVDLTSNQNITGRKTFNQLKVDTDCLINNLKLGQAGSYYEFAKYINQNYLALASVINNDIKVHLTMDQSKVMLNEDFAPYRNSEYDLGSSTYKWKDLYLTGNLTDGTNSVAISNIATKTMVDDLKKNSFISVNTTTYPTLEDFLESSGEEGYIYLYPINTSDLTQGYYRYIWENNDWLSLGSTQIDLSNYYTKSESDDKYVALSGSQTISGSKTFTGLTVLRNTEVDGDLDVLSTLDVRGDSTFRSKIAPFVDDSTDIGKPVINGSPWLRWRNLYLSGNLSDGTNSISIADLVGKADKVGALPKYSLSGSTNIVSFINTNNLNGVPFVFSYNNKSYLSIMEYTPPVEGGIPSGVFTFYISDIGSNDFYNGLEITIGTYPVIPLSSLFDNQNKDTYEKTSNKVTSLSSNSTNNQYPSAKCVWDTTENVRKVAEGKCQTFVLHNHSYSITSGTVHDDTTGTNVLITDFYVYDTTTNKWKSDLLGLSGGNYNGITILNQNFNSQDNLVQLENGYVLAQKDNGYYLLNFTQISVYGLNIGDILLIIETDVPDRWYGGTSWQIGQSAKSSFYEMETTKVPLENYWAKSELVALTTSEWETMIGD